MSSNARRVLLCLKAGAGVGCGVGCEGGALENINSAHPSKLCA